MAKSKKSIDWGFEGNVQRDRAPDHFLTLVKFTKLRTLADMSEREIKGLEREYGCPVQRPAVSNRRRRSAAA